MDGHMHQKKANRKDSCDVWLSWWWIRTPSSCWIEQRYHPMSRVPICYNGFLGIHSSMKIISRRELIIVDIIITAYGRCIETVELSTDAGSRWCWSASVVLVSSVSASRHRKEEDPAVAGSSSTSGEDSWCHLRKVLRDSHLTAEPCACFDFPP